MDPRRLAPRPPALRRLGRELGRSLERMGQTGGFMTP